MGAPGGHVREQALQILLADNIGQALQSAAVETGALLMLMQSRACRIPFSLARLRGVPFSTARAVFEQLQVFGSYAFPKSHAVAFALIVYQSAWLKCYHPAALCCALLNNQPMGFWPPSVLFGYAKRAGVTVFLVVFT